jgi:hypothetical protein
VPDDTYIVRIHQTRIETVFFTFFVKFDLEACLKQTYDVVIVGAGGAAAKGE